MESTPQLQHFFTWSDLDLHNHNASRNPFGSQKPQMGTYWTTGQNARLPAPPLSLSMDIYIYFFFLLPGKALQNTSLSEQVISCLRLPQPTFEKCAKITFAALDWPQKIFGGSCYAFRWNYCWPFLQKNSSLFRYFVLSLPSRLKSRSPNYWISAVAGLCECLSPVWLFPKTTRIFFVCFFLAFKIISIWREWNNASLMVKYLL